jgi:hypothetical protein
VKLDDAKKKLAEIALDELGKEFTQYFNAQTGGVPNAAQHFETGVKVLLATEANALEIIARILEG